MKATSLRRADSREGLQARGVARPTKSQGLKGQSAQGGKKKIDNRLFCLGGKIKEKGEGSGDAKRDDSGAKEKTTPGTWRKK